MRSRIFFLFACFALGAFLMSATPASGYACGKTPCNQDPGGGGGGGLCTTQWCYLCGDADPTGYAPCLGGTRSGACSCNYPGGVCQEYGQCTYVP